MKRERSLVAALGVIAAALLAASLLLILLGVNPVRALGALVEGAMGDRLAWENTILRMIPLLLIGLGIALAFRCGVWNIGGEGQFYAGAGVATALATRLPAGIATWGAVAVVGLGSLAGGALWGGIAGILRVRRGVSEVLSTILLNFIAILLVAWAVHGPLQELSGAYPQSDPFPEAARLARFPGLGRIHYGVLIALGLPVLLWFGLFRTAAGLRLRAVGLSPEVSRYTGISPEREWLGVLCFSGALAGLAGGLEVSGVTGRLFENLSSGYGFTAIAVALLARLDPLAVVPSALFFAALETGSGAMQRTAHVPSVTVQVIEGLVILFSVGLAFPAHRSG